MIDLTIAHGDLVAGLLGYVVTCGGVRSAGPVADRWMTTYGRT